jgi:hypothetical protein
MDIVNLTTPVDIDTENQIATIFETMSAKKQESMLETSDKPSTQVKKVKITFFADNTINFINN